MACVGWLVLLGGMVALSSTYQLGVNWFILSLDFFLLVGIFWALYRQQMEQFRTVIHSFLIIITTMYLGFANLSQSFSEFPALRWQDPDAADRLNSAGSATFAGTIIRLIINVSSHTSFGHMIIDYALKFAWLLAFGLHQNSVVGTIVGGDIKLKSFKRAGGNNTINNSAVSEKANAAEEAA